MATDKRLTIRLSDDLHGWLESQAAQNALDVAAFVRMSLQRMRTGHVGQPAPPQDAPQPLPTYRDKLPEMVLSTTDYAGPPAVEPDDLVRAALDRVATQDAAQPRQPNEQDEDEFLHGVRPVGERHVRDPYNMKQYAR